MSTEHVSQTVRDLAPLLLPLLPYFTKGVESFGTELVKSAGQKVGEMVPDVINRIWKKLEPKIKETPGAESAIKSVIENPKDQRAVGAFELALEDILGDENLREELGILLRQTRTQGITVEQITHLGKVYGEIVNVNVDDAGSLENAKIKSKLTANEIKAGGKVTGVHLGKKKD